MLAIESGIVSVDLQEHGTWQGDVQRVVRFHAPFASVPEVTVSFCEIEADISAEPGDGLLRLRAAVEARFEDRFDLRVSVGSSGARLVTVSWIAYGERT